MNEAWLQQPEATELISEELEQYLAFQKKVGWRRTGTPVFESFFSILPFVPSEQALVRERDGIKEILMWRRKDAHYDGWHMTGGYVLRGESDEEWVSRVIKKETDLTLKQFFAIRRFNTRPDTGWVPNHQMAVFFLCEVEGEPSAGKFFPIYPKPEIPDDTLGHHKKYLDCLRAHFMRMETMCAVGIRWDYMDKAPQWGWRCVWDEEADPVLVPRDMRGRRRRDFPSLDEAACFFKENVKGMKTTVLFDDQGLQIL